jgi:hypothetical protein
MSQLPDIQDNNEQLLNDIQSLQQIEQQFFTSLETNPDLSPIEQQKIVDKINQVSNMRVTLYKTLSDINNYYGSTLSTSLGTLREQTAAIGVIEDELNRSKKNLEMLELEKNNKIRLVEINNYYGEKYEEHASLMKIIIFTLVPIVIISILNNKGILPNFIFYIILIVVCIIGGIYFWYRFASIIMRDNLNYQKYDWGFNPATAPKSSSVSSDPWASLQMPGTCIGEACCSDGQLWDPSIDQCIGTSKIVNPNVKPKQKESSWWDREAQAATETFVSNVLTKTANSK